jgi:molybdopterin molybdotransferase
MIACQDALREILRRVRPLGAETVPLAEAAGRTLAADVRAADPVPPFAKATMDGYAVRAADTKGAAGGTPVVLDVIEDLPAGRTSRKSLGPGRAIRIMTGAPLPRGCDAVAMVEDTEKDGTRVIVRAAVDPGDNIGSAGEDVRKGERVLEKGRVVGPAEIGMLAAVGRASVRVARRPLLAVIATGDEIVEPGERLGPGRIRNANGYSLTAQADQAGAQAVYLGIARDNPAALKRTLRKAEGADILVLSGGVSVGDYDLVRDELIGSGVKPVFWRVSIKPGKPTFFGTSGRRLVFGLPGNPTSAMVTFHLFVRPAIDTMLGRAETGPRPGKAVLARTIVLEPGRTQFLRAVLAVEGAELRADPFPDQRSGVLRSMVASRALIVVPSTTGRLEKGALVDILHLE